MNALMQVAVQIREHFLILWTFDSNNGTEFLDTLDALMTILVRFQGSDVVCTASRLSEQESAHVSLKNLCRDLVAKSPNIEYHLTQTTLVSNPTAFLWYLLQLQRICTSFGSLSCAQIFAAKYLNEFDRLTLYMHGLLFSLAGDLVESRINAVEVESRILFVIKLVEFQEVEGICDSEGNIVVDRRLQEALQTLSSYGEQAIHRLSAIESSLKAMAKSDFGSPASRIDLDVLGNVYEHREILFCLLSMKKIRALFCKAVDMQHSLRAIDESALALLNELCRFTALTADNVRDSECSNFDVASRRQEIQRVAQIADQAYHACEVLRSWSNFDSSTVVALSKSFSETNTKLGLCIEALDEHAKSLVKGFSDAISAADEVLRRLRCTNSDTAVVVDELLDAEKWERWNAFLAREGKNGFFFQDLFSYFGEHSQQVKILDCKMSAIVTELQARCGASSRNLISVASKDSMRLLEYYHADACVLLSFMRIPKGSSLCNRILHQR